MKLAIAMATYAREDGKTPFFLVRALESVFAQEHQDFKMFLTGDDYRPREELNNLVAQYPQDKIKIIHLNHAVEREKYKGDPEKLWNNGGVTAYNTAVEEALAEGFNYICKLDHDDYWLPRHLRIISETIDQTAADFVCTGAMVSNGKLPNIENKDYLISFLPKAAGIIHSSTCYNHLVIPIRSRDAGELPSDYDKWKRMAQYIKDNNLKSYFINDFTCIWEPGTYERNKRHWQKGMIAVSICCLTYNHEKLIRDALNGFVMQKTKFSFEIVIHDDASTDGTLKIIREYQRRYEDIPFTILTEKDNQFSKTGIYPFWTHLYPAARGKYIAECDGDDYWMDPLKLQKQYDCMEAHPGCQLCYHDYHTHNVKSGEKYKHNPGEPENYTAEDLINYRHRKRFEIHTSTKFWRNLWLAYPEQREFLSKFWGDYPTTVLQGVFGSGRYVEGINPSIFRRDHEASSWTNLLRHEREEQTRKMRQRILDGIMLTENKDWIEKRIKKLNG